MIISTKQLSSLFVGLVLGCCCSSCSDIDELGVPLTDNTIPQQPTNIKVKNLNGAAEISYTVPNDKDLMCVTASYDLNGKNYRVNASPYVNKLKVEGFGDEKTYTVYLKSIDKSRNESEAISVEVNPKESPINMIFKTLQVHSSFGGLKINWNNKTQANVIISVMKKDSLDAWQSIENFYTSTKEGLATVRGLDSIPMTIGVKVRDRWDNYSDLKVSEQKPLFEEEINKKNFKGLFLPGDTKTWSTSIGNIEAMWDGDTWSENSMFHGDGGDIGEFCTFDLGKVVKLSRFKHWQRTAYAAWIYDHNNLKHFKVYGCENLTDEMRMSGSLDGWTMINDVWTPKPSGDSGVVTNEDVEAAKAGHEVEFDISTPPVRYIRFEFLETWSKGDFVQIQEVSFWGKVIK